MKKYEYGQLYNDQDDWVRTWVFKTTEQSKIFNDTRHLLATLDKLGTSGWELVVHDKESETYILKREIS